MSSLQALARQSAQTCSFRPRPLSSSVTAPSTGRTLTSRSGKFKQTAFAAAITVDFVGPKDVSRPSVQQREAAPERVEAKRKTVRAQASSSSQSTSQQGDKNEGLPSSLFLPFENLPPEGRSIAIEEETCNPEERRCKTPIHVWEVKCKACYGTGQITSRSRRGSRSAYTCLCCQGIGYVRRSSSRIVPDLSNGAYTLGRKKATSDPSSSQGKKRK